MVMKFPSYSTTIVLVLLSILLGGASGVIATALTSTALSDYAVQLNEQTRPILTTDHAPKSFPSSYADATNRFIDSSLPSVATIFLKSAKGSFGYSREAIAGTGVVFTADGWITTSNVPKLPMDQLAIGVKQHVYDVTRIVIDPVTNITFLKIQATDLPVVGFGKAFDLTMGQQIFTVTNTGALIDASVRSQEWPQGVLMMSDVPLRRLSVSSDSSEAGNLAFDLSGAFVGFILKQDVGKQLLPLEDILPALTALLEKKEITHPSLGVQYIDIAHAIGLPEKFMRGHTTGAYLTGKPAVKKGSAAAIAGLNEGDIILAMNGQSIDETHSLDERLLAFRPGDSVLISIDRLGEKQNMNVVLGEYVK